ncbi:hypothetical protein [Caldifermentibacillus hisashii]|uniref:hypothetical protein n=3 Tax=Bacillati TaxID=1783272 RepID=UPI003D21EEB6
MVPMLKRRKWTLKETFLSKTRLVLILTIILTVVFNKLVNQLLTRHVPVENGLYSYYTYEYSLGIYGVVFAIPAIFLSILIVRFFLNLTNKNQSKTSLSRNDFIWYSLYGKVIGLIIFVLLSKVANFFTSKMEVTNLWEGFQWFGLVAIIPAIFAFFVAMLTNKYMIRLTRTNKRLVNEIESGLYDTKLRNEKTKIRVLKRLKKGNVSTIQGALWRIRIIDFFIFIGMTLLTIIMFIVELFSPNSAGSSSSVGGGIRMNRLQQKQKTELELKRQKEKTAYAAKEYVKQMNYNSNTIFAQNRADDLKRELKKQKELEEQMKRF